MGRKAWLTDKAEAHVAEAKRLLRPLRAEDSVILEAALADYVEYLRHRRASERPERPLEASEGAGR